MNGLTWVGHSSVVIELDGVRLITDPVLGRRIAHLVRAEAVPQELLGGLDAVLVSHTHLDHLDFPSLRRIGRAVPVVVPTGARGMLRRRGFEHVVELAEGDEHRIGSLRVDATHAEHGVVRRYVRATSAALGFIVRGSSTVYFAGDTDLFEGMAELGPIDLAVLPVAGWGPRIPAGHLDARRAAEALALIRPSCAVPVHWGTFRTPFGRADVERAGEVFRRDAAELAPDVDVRVLAVGETLRL